MSKITKLEIPVNRGNVRPDECGDCQFRQDDDQPTHRFLCWIEQWGLPDVTDGKRHMQCLAAECGDSR